MTINKQLDLIYDQIDALCLQEKFEAVDKIISGLNLKQLSIEAMLAYLTATYPAKYKLSTRAQFLMAIETEIKRRKRWSENLLIGL